jgi:prepilin-type N-terminal cleavage/methylation domain-containing protein
MSKGFTLIEIIVVMAIMSIIASCGVMSVRYYKSVTNKVDADYYCNAIVSFINNSKVYCRENYCSATITFDIKGNQMRLAEGANTVNKLIFSNKITLCEVNGRRTNGAIVIDNYGYSNDACTIRLKDNNLIEHEITMRVDTSYVKIKK